MAKTQLTADDFIRKGTCFEGVYEYVHTLSLPSAMAVDGLLALIPEEYQRILEVAEWDRHGHDDYYYGNDYGYGDSFGDGHGYGFSGGGNISGIGNNYGRSNSWGDGDSDGYGGF